MTTSLPEKSPVLQCLLSFNKAKKSYLQFSSSAERSLLPPEDSKSNENSTPLSTEPLSPDGGYLLYSEAATFCARKPESAEEQLRLNGIVFSEAFDPSSVRQEESYTIIRIGDYELVANQKLLGSGSYGSVFLFTDSSKGVHLAIKFSKADDEGKISKALLTAGCRVLKVQAVGQKLLHPLKGTSQYAYFMELAEGTLFTFLKILSTENMTVPLSLGKQKLVNIFLHIGEEIRYQMLCLYNVNSDFVYMDLKVTNVLFKCDSQDRRNTVRFFLGDLGGAVPDEKSRTYASTYPPPEHRGTGGRMVLQTRNEKLSAMSWQLGVLLLYMVGNTAPEFRTLEYPNIKKLNQGTYNLLYDLMVAFYGQDIAQLLHSKPEKRRSFLESLL